MEAKCPACNELISIKSAAAGTIGRCGACKGMYTVGQGGLLRPLRPAEPETPAPAEPVVNIRYKCMKCKAVLESPSSLSGEIDHCPLCGQANRIPQPKKRRRSKPPASTSAPVRGDFEGEDLSAFDPLSDLRMAAGSNSSRPSNSLNGGAPESAAAATVTATADGLPIPSPTPRGATSINTIAGLSAGSLACSIAGIFAAGAMLGIAGIVLGSAAIGKARYQGRRSEPVVAEAGIVLGVIATVIGFYWFGWAMS